MPCFVWKRALRITMIFPAILVAASLGLSQKALSAADTGCAANPDNRALDFWLGEWTIAAPGGSATSGVTLELGKCMVVERWDGGRGHSGENLFAYSADDKSWHGMFADNEGRVHVFLDGKVANGTAEFSGPSRGSHGETVLNRVKIHRISETHVEQIWQKSVDGGKTWRNRDAFTIWLAMDMPGHSNTPRHTTPLSAHGFVSTSAKSHNQRRSTGGFAL
jgi:hypothetical protein